MWAVSTNIGDVINLRLVQDGVSTFQKYVPYPQIGNYYEHFFHSYYERGLDAEENRVDVQVLRDDAQFLLLGASVGQYRPPMYVHVIIVELEDTVEYGKRKKYRVHFDLASFGFPEEDLDIPIYFGD